MSLITENNRQYYEGAQGFRSDGTTSQFTTTFNTDLVFGAPTPSSVDYVLNNFKIYSSSNGMPGTWTEYDSLTYTVSGNTINFGGSSVTITVIAPGSANYVDINTLTGSANVGDKVEIAGATWSGSFSYAIITAISPSPTVTGATRYEWNPAIYGNATYGSGQVVTFKQPVVFDANNHIVVQLKKLDGGEYGATPNDKAYGNVVEDNWGSYAYTKLGDVINNFLVAYVGAGKLIPSVKRTDVIFHAKRAIQEFSYDTLKSVNKLEVSIPHNLSIAMPQDYVNYVNLYWIDQSGVKRVIMPADMLTTNPTDLFLQNTKGIPIQDQFNDNIDTTSVTEDRWKNNILKERTDPEFIDDTILGLEYYYGWPQFGYGQLYGLDPQFANSSGYYTINERENKFSFSANLVDKIVVIEYISDGLSTDLGTRIPKLAEEALYAYLKHAILATRINQPEYIIQRLKKEASAQLRNAKIRLSNIKLDQIVQVMRGKSKQIKH